MDIQNSELENYLRQLLTSDYPGFINANPEPLAIRVNTLKTTVPAFEEKLLQWQVDYQPHPLNPTGFILQEDKLPLSHTLAFFLGEFFYQGIASQLPVLALDPQPGETILDMSAAPGSKATQIAALMNNSGQLVLNDPSPGRNTILTRHAHRAGIQHDVVLRAPGQQIGQLFPEFFDRVLVDAPCSGLGTFAAKPGEIA
ncbi:RsmB/NOP family class I SAM-dependent RNA methyltransferase, partial [candidate division KSB1 bacterium]|nr:RsmB/NOP family class I SAM-dependent RNA methyltransferase [candidate division KSB1 bacterium]